MEPIIVTALSRQKPGVLQLRSVENVRQPWVPTPRLAIDVHTICWYQVGVPFSRRIPPTRVSLPDGSEATTDEGTMLPFLIGTSFGTLQFIVPVTAFVKGEAMPLNTDLISELLEQFHWFHSVLS